MFRLRGIVVDYSYLMILERLWRLKLKIMCFQFLQCFLFFNIPLGKEGTHSYSWGFEE